MFSASFFFFLFVKWDQATPPRPPKWGAGDAVISHLVTCAFLSHAHHLVTCAVIGISFASSISA
jgi:hypothetical protein